MEKIIQIYLEVAVKEHTFVETKIRNMNYQIKISYSTGDSFKNYDTISILDPEWEDLQIAKENLKFIREHYVMYQELHSYSNKKDSQEIFAENADKPWFVTVEKLGAFKNGKFDHVIKPKNQQMWIERGFTVKPFYAEYEAESCLKLKMDNGNWMQLHAFWTGCFEQLYGAKIITKKDEEMEFTI